AQARRAVAQSWRDTLAGTPAERAPALLRGAARRRDHHPQRLVVPTERQADTVGALGDFIAGADSAVVSGTAVRDGKLAFVFAGNGAQWPGMAQQTYRASAVFRDAIGAADDALQPGLGWSVAEAIDGGIE